MSDPLEHIEYLAQRARMDVAPQGDVRTNVLRQLRQSQPSQWSTPMAVFTLGYGVLSAATILFGISLLDLTNEPLMALFEYANTIAP